MPLFHEFLFLNFTVSYVSLGVYLSFLHTYLGPYQSIRLQLCRTKICPHFFTLILKCIREAACRYAAIRLAIIFSLIF